MTRRLLCALLLSAAPLSAQQVGIPHRLFQLENGLRLIVHEDHSIPMAAVNVWYHVGAAYEEPGRTGFAHLFEHIMFEGSANVPEGEFDNLLEAAGANNNGSTDSDRTNYYEVLPSNAVDLALWLEADRMGGLLQTMGQGKLDIQRDVVKNERRQRYENRPYGLLFPTAAAALYPASHPYSWTAIGSMEDLTAASLSDVEGFFRRYYVPNNAVIAVAGDVNPEEIRRTVERFFGWIPRGEAVARPIAPTPPIIETKYVTLEDRVTLPQITLLWRTSKAYSPDDAAMSALASILTQGKNSRLYRRLVYEEQVAQDVSAFNYSRLLSGDLFLTLTGREGTSLDRLESTAIQEIQRLAATPPTDEELQRVKSAVETQLVGGLERLGTRAELLNQYLYYTGDPDHVAEELAQYRALTPADIQRVARDYLAGKNRVVISIVPTGKTNLAAGEDR
ncbi:MAG: insulinase family protein [Gemmatimonadetes bacterium]|nr:insulinase family protein [Gemmatimonadota bacterium]